MGHPRPRPPGRGLAFARIPAGIDPGAPAGHSLRKIGNTNCPPAAEPLCRAGRDAFIQMHEPDRRVIAAKADIVAALRAIEPGAGVIVAKEEDRKSKRLKSSHQFTRWYTVST